MKFGEKLKHLRQKHNLSQEELGELLGFSSSAIGQYENNRREPNFERLRIIKDFFKVDYNFLLEDNKNDREAIKKIELDVVDLKEILKKNYVIINGRKMGEKAKEGLLMFLENY